MDKRTIELTQREAMLLSIAIHGFGRSYKGAKNKCKTENAENKYDNIIEECLNITRKIESVFNMVVPIDDNNIVLGDISIKKKTRS